MTVTQDLIDERGNLVTLRTDTVVAQEIRDELTPLLDKVCEVMAKAKASGMQVAWNIQPDSFGRRFRIAEITIVKPL